MKKISKFEAAQIARKLFQLGVAVMACTDGVTPEESVQLVLAAEQLVKSIADALKD